MARSCSYMDMGRCWRHLRVGKHMGQGKGIMREKAFNSGENGTIWPGHVLIWTWVGARDTCVLENTWGRGKKKFFILLKMGRYC